MVGMKAVQLVVKRVVGMVENSVVKMVVEKVYTTAELMVPLMATLRGAKKVEWMAESKDLRTAA